MLWNIPTKEVEQRNQSKGRENIRDEGQKNTQMHAESQNNWEINNDNIKCIKR